MELKIYSEILPGEIRNNLDDFIKDVKNEVAPYKGLVFEPSDIKGAKKTVAGIRKYRKEIEDRRKLVKRDWMQPYTAFAAKVKEALSFIDEVVDPIAAQISEVEAQRLRDRSEAIDEMKVKLLEGSVADVCADAPWFYDPRWMNASVSLKKVESEILLKREMIEKNLRTIYEVGGEYENRLIEKYHEIGDISRTLLFRKELIQKEEQVRKIQEDMDRKREEPVKPTKEEHSPLVIGIPAEDGIGEDPVSEEEEQAPEITIRLLATGTKKQLIGLREYCDTRGIKIDRA